jgi:hypothetical protein
MNNNNNIDSFFQEKLNNLEVAPPNMAWNNIERELKKKNNRKVIPLWWKFSGVAAILIIGIFIGTQFSSNFNNQKPEDKEQMSNSKEQRANGKIVNSNNQKISNENAINVVVTTEKNLNSSKKEDLSQNAISENQINQDQVVVIQTKQKSNISNPNEIAIKKLKSNKKEIQILPETEYQVTENEPLLNNSKLVQTENLQEKGNLQNEKTKIEITSPIEITPKKPSLIIAEQEKQILIEEKTKKITSKSALANKWQIAPNFAPMYFNSTSNNSPIDSKLDNNNKLYDKSTSFGVAVNYAITNKITIRSGINKFDVGYNTNNIGYYQGSSTLINSVNLPVENTTIISVQNDNINLPPTNIATVFTQMPKISEGTLSQKTTYLEVPLEVSYAVLNKKIGVNIVAGFSTLLLNKNQIVITSNSENINLGEATNLNKMHYSGNIGLGFNYKLMKSFQINFEPILKYQFNTYSTEVGNYKPYFIGLYSGVSYCF